MSPLVWMLTVWGVLTAILVVLLIYRSTLTMHEDDEQLFHAIRVGAAAYATKDSEAEEIIKLIRRVARGESRRQ